MPENRSLQPCGTMAAYKRHRNRGETPCPACAEANRVDYRRRYAATGAGKAWSVPSEGRRRDTDQPDPLTG